jgi:hypothetical protein
MTPFDAAAELCAMAGAPDLLAYLSLPADAGPGQRAAALEGRLALLRRDAHLPRYEREAHFVAAHVDTLHAALRDLSGHLADMAARAERRHGGELELQLRGLLVSGPLDPDRESRWVRGARALGLAEGWALALIGRVTGEPVLPPITGVAPVPGPSLYEVLQVPPDADADTIRAAASARGASDPRVDIAARVLLSAAARRLYDARAVPDAPDPYEDGETELYTQARSPKSPPPPPVRQMVSLPSPNAEQQRMHVEQLVFQHKDARRRYDQMVDPPTPAPLGPRRTPSIAPLEDDAPPAPQGVPAAALVALLTLWAVLALVAIALLLVLTGQIGA